MTAFTSWLLNHWNCKSLIPSHGLHVTRVPSHAHSCNVRTAKHPVPDQVKPSFVIFDIRALSALSGRECPDVKNYNRRLSPVWHRILYSCTQFATVGVKGLTNKQVMATERTSVRSSRRWSTSHRVWSCVGFWLSHTASTNTRPGTTWPSSPACTIYTVFRKKTPTHIFFHISMNYLWI